MECYGRSFGRLKTCGKCRYQKFCAEAADPPPILRERSKRADSVDDLPDTAPLPSDIPAERVPAPDPRRYTRQELLEVIGFMVRLDESTLNFLAEKFEHPEFGYADLARKRNISRQAVHKFIRQRCRKIPELEAILLKSSLKKHSNTTFLEAVCRIRRKTREKPSKKPKADLNSLKRLTCSIRSLSLSGTSMFSGGSIWKSASAPSSPPSADR